MALYDFVCDDCDHEQEELIRPSQLDTAIILCEKCGSKKMKRAISRPNGFVRETQTPTRS